MNVFENLGEEKAREMVDELIAKGYSEDEAFSEVYSIECNMDEEDKEDDLNEKAILALVNKMGYEATYLFEGMADRLRAILDEIKEGF